LLSNKNLGYQSTTSTTALSVNAILDTTAGETTFSTAGKSVKKQHTTSFKILGH
jgi:hypothetical protein